MFERFSNSPALRLLVSASAGLLAYGAWAFIANMEHGNSMAYRAAITQGSYSFVITLLLTGIMEWSFKLHQGSSQRMRFWKTCIPVCVLLYLSSWVVNFLAGTPNIFLTILPGAILSSVYTFSYVAALGKIGK